MWQTWWLHYFKKWPRNPHLQQPPSRSVSSPSSRTEARSKLRRWFALVSGVLNLRYVRCFFLGVSYSTLNRPQESIGIPLHALGNQNLHLILDCAVSIVGRSGTKPRRGELMALPDQEGQVHLIPSPTKRGKQKMVL